MESRESIVAANRTAGYSCCQTIFTAYCDIYGIDRELGLRLSFPFGGGFARTQGMCGIVAAGAMLIALKEARNYPEATSEEVWEGHFRIREYMDDFKKQYGSLYCRDIIGFDITTPDGLAKSHCLMEERCLPAILGAAQLLEGKYGILQGR